MVEVYSSALRTRYYAPWLSLTTFIRVGFLVALIVGSFFLAYSSGGFWVKQMNYNEQPIVHFKRQILLTLGTLNATTLDAKSYAIKYASTMPQFNKLVSTNGENILPIQASAASTDVNNDNVPDAWKIKISVPANEWAVVSASMVLFFEVQMTQKLSMSMEAVVPLSHQGGGTLPGQTWNINGNLQFYQINALPLRGNRTVYNTPLLNLGQPGASGLPSTLADVMFPAIIQANAMRNESMIIQWPQIAWLSAPSSSRFTIDVNLRVPVSTIQFIPNPAETLKFAWIQYLAVLVFLWFLAQWPLFYLFEHGIVDTIRRKDTTPVFKEHLF